MGKKLMTLAAYDLEVGMTLANGHKIVEVKPSDSLPDFVWFTLDNGDVFGSALLAEWSVVDNEHPDTPFTVAKMAYLLEYLMIPSQKKLFNQAMSDYPNPPMVTLYPIYRLGYRLADVHAPIRKT